MIQLFNQLVVRKKLKNQYLIIVRYNQSHVSTFTTC